MLKKRLFWAFWGGFTVIANVHGSQSGPSSLENVRIFQLTAALYVEHVEQMLNKKLNKPVFGKDSEMASITKRIGKDGIVSYLIRVSNGRRTDGKQVVASETFFPTEKSPKRIKAELDAFVRDFEMRVHEGKFVQGNKMTFDQFVIDWKNGWASKNLTLSSIQDYSRILEKRVAPSIGGLKIAKISPLHIQRIIDEESARGMKIKTVKRTFTAINSVFKYAFQMQVIKENPCQRVQLPKEKVDQMNNGYVEEIHYFDLEQANRFLKALTMEYVYTEKEHDCLWGKSGKVYHVKAREK